MRIMIEGKENKQNWHKNRIIFNSIWIPNTWICSFKMCLICAAIDSRNKSNWHRLLPLRMATVSSFSLIYIYDFVFPSILFILIWIFIFIFVLTFTRSVFHCDFCNQNNAQIAFGHNTDILKIHWTR